MTTWGSFNRTLDVLLISAGAPTCNHSHSQSRPTPTRRNPVTHSRKHLHRRRISPILRYALFHDHLSAVSSTQCTTSKVHRLVSAVLGSYTSLQTRPVDRFMQKNSHTTCFRLRTCLIGLHKQILMFRTCSPFCGRF